jgi:hypothetical protein
MLLKIERQMQNQTGTGPFSLLVGFFMAISNHLFGWLNSIEPANHIPSMLQALLMGIFGAIGTYIGNQGIKYFKNRFKKDGNK